jgi:hypothetical protein
MSQGLLYLKKALIATVAAYEATHTTDRIHWIKRAVENYFLATLAGFAVAFTFFVYPFLMLPFFSAQSAYFVMRDTYQLINSRNDEEKALHFAKKNHLSLEKTDHLLNKIYKKRKERYKSLLLNIVMLGFCVLSCLDPPLLYTIGLVGCLATALAPYLPSLWKKSTPTISEKNIAPSQDDEVTAKKEVSHIKLAILTTQWKKKSITEVDTALRQIKRAELGAESYKKTIETIRHNKHFSFFFQKKPETNTVKISEEASSKSINNLRMHWF